MALLVAAGVGVVINQPDDVATAAADRSSPAAPVADVTATLLPSTTDTSPSATTALGTSPASTPSTFSPTTSDSAPPPAGSNPSLALRPVADLDSPSGLIDLPGAGPVLVSSLDGRIRSVDLVTGASTVVLDLSGIISSGGERGLLNIVASPDGSRLYANFTDRGGDTEIRSWPIAGGRPQGGPNDGVLHLEIGQPYANHNGGNLEFGPDGLLWIGTGDGGSAGDPGDEAQDVNSLLGKMLRVQPNPAGGVIAPSDNPRWGGRPEIWGIGLRNPWRYSFDSATGKLWIGDVGQRAREEVSVIDPGADRPNFGWDDVEGDRPFEGSVQSSFTAPVVTYGHDDDGGCSITGGRVYRGTAVPSLAGWYLFGDYCGGWIRAVPADDPTRTPVELNGDVGPIISFEVLDTGELVILTPSGIQAIVAS